MALLKDTAYKKRQRHKYLTHSSIKSHSKPRHRRNLGVGQAG